MSEHTCGGCCCGEGGGCCHAAQEPKEPVALNAAQKEFLVEVSLHSYLPLTRFIRTNDASDDVYIVALAPVYLITAADTMEAVKETGRFLSEMEAAGLISLDYGTPLEGYPYLEYTSSTLFAYFTETVREGKERSPDFIGSMPYLEFGSIGITTHGSRSLELS